MSIQGTVKFGDKLYATVPDRLKEFRQTHPRAKVFTDPLFQADGSLVFKAEIITDLADSDSARATGHARYDAKELAKPKAFEKLETVATGRALALLGYLNDGQIATTEEMDEFNQFKLDKVAEAIEAIKVAKDTNELAAIQASVPGSQQRELNGAIRERLAELNATSNKQPA